MSHDRLGDISKDKKRNLTKKITGNPKKKFYNYINNLEINPKLNPFNIYGINQNLFQFYFLRKYSRVQI